MEEKIVWRRSLCGGEVCVSADCVLQATKGQGRATRLKRMIRRELGARVVARRPKLRINAANEQQTTGRGCKEKTRQKQRQVTCIFHRPPLVDSRRILYIYVYVYILGTSLGFFINSIRAIHMHTHTFVLCKHT